MPLDHYVSLGRSGLYVSPLCLGTMTFGEEGGMGASPDISKQMLDFYIDHGGNFIDTADAYSSGHAEKIIGDHIGRVPSKRDRVVIATKFGTNFYYGDPNGGGASRKAIIAACENSLRRLQTDYIDLYWQHWRDPVTPIDETMRAFDDLVTSGKIRYIGMSDTPAWKVAEAQVTARFRNWAPLIALQIEYSLNERSVENELVPMALSMGLGITSWGPLAMGALTGKYTRQNRVNADSRRTDYIQMRLTEKALDIVDCIVEIAHKRETTPSRVAIAWLCAQPGVTAPIIGARTPAQLDDNLGALDLKLMPEDLEVLSTASAPVSSFPSTVLPILDAHAWGGMTVNGQTYPHYPFSPTKERLPY